MTKNAITDQRRAVTTAGAAAYLGVSASLVRKWRTRGPLDPGSSGPEFIRAGATLVLYEIEALDRWIEERRIRPLPPSKVGQRGV